MGRAAFVICASKRCRPRDVAGDLVPSVLSSLSHAHIMQGNVRHDMHGSLQLITLHDTSASGMVRQLGTLGARVPPADLSTFRRFFWICGTCDLARYGDSHDGGYVMCKIPRKLTAQLKAIYSYGIEERDAWGHALTEIYGAPLHQYDCMNINRPRCPEPCLAEFHEVCLGDDRHPEWLEGRRYQTLAESLMENGHAVEKPNSLVLKLDIEGMEWHVLSTISKETLTKFEQVIVEFHLPYLHYLVHADLIAVRIAALRRLLRHLVVVHVHPNNKCKYPEPGSCLEVSFASHSIVKRLASCRRPQRHALDAPNYPDMPDINVSSLF